MKYYSISGTGEICANFNGESYLLIYGRHVNGYFCCFPSRNKSCEMSDPSDEFYNYERLVAAGFTDIEARFLATLIFDKLMKKIDEDLKEQFEEKENENLKQLFEQDHLEKLEYLRQNPDFVPDGDFWDSHSCSRFADADGYCQFCGDVVAGSFAYWELYGGE